MLEKITLRDFRCFHQEQTARLAPLTLLVGENSTGKTSFMALIRALWDAAYSDDPPDFKKEPYDLGSFGEIAHHRGAGGQADTFTAGFDVTPTNILGRGNENGPHRFEFIFGKKGAAPVLVQRKLSHEKTWVEEHLEEGSPWHVRFGTQNGVWQRKDKPARGPLFGPLANPIFGESLEEANKGITPLGDSPPLTETDWHALQPFFDYLYRRVPVSLREEIPLEKARPFASAPVRSHPRRTYDPFPPVENPEGDYVPMYLSHMYFEDKERWTALKKRLDAFGQAAGLFNEISIKSFGKREGDPFQLQVRRFGKKRKGPWRNLIDVGYGVSQVLPIIAELLRPDLWQPFSDLPIFLLQQPEVHLHPSAQAALGSLFCQLAGPERQLVVETHSDHLLDRVRMDVRDGKGPLKPDDVSVLFFERGELDVLIHSLRLDDLGNVLDAPPSYRQFFMEETQRSLGL